MSRLRDLLQDESEEQDIVEIVDATFSILKRIHFAIQYATNRGYWLEFRNVSYALGKSDVEPNVYILQDREEIHP